MSSSHHVTAWLTANLSAAEGPDGTALIGCPKCGTNLSIAPAGVECPSNACDYFCRGAAHVCAQDAARVAAAKAATDKHSAGLPLWTIDDVLAHQPDPKDEIWEGGVLYAAERTAIVGAPGVGKSRLALQAAVDTVLGRKFLAWETFGEGTKWLFLQTENSARRLKADLSAMTAGLPRVAMLALSQSIRLLNIMATDLGTICMTEGHPDRLRIETTLEAWNPDVVVIDPLRDAGLGDMNKDADMTATCLGINSVIRRGNPRRVPLVVHHGRTGAAEAAKVFGDDKASFGRNSKVLFGWLRSQINVAAAGVDHPDTIIIGCGKNSNGENWEPFAAKLNPGTMMYQRTPFDLEAWASAAGVRSSGSGAPVKIPTPEQVAEILKRHGGALKGGKNDSHGLVAALQDAHRIPRRVAEDAIRSALGVTIQSRMLIAGGKEYVLRAA